MNLPPADPLLVAQTIEGLPARLQKRLDAMVAADSGWTFAGGVVDLGSAKVALQPEGGVLRRAENVTCDCLLAPTCLHRAAVLSAAPVAGAEVGEEAVPSVGEVRGEGLPHDGGRGTSREGEPSGETRLPRDVELEGERAVGSELARDGEPDVGPGPVGGAELVGIVGPAGKVELAGSAGPPGSAELAGSAGRAGNVELAGSAAAPISPQTPSPLWSAAETAAARMIWDAASQLLEAGLAGAGTALQGQLLAGVHQARLRALHRLAAATTRTVTAIRAARSDDASFSLPSLSADLLEVLSVAHAVISGKGEPAEWRGTARTVYEGVGGLRLAGLCMEPVISSAGYAGVVVWLIDADGRLWSVSDVKPGDSARVQASAAGPVAAGETGLSHRDLSRAGLIMASATANPDGRLGAGNAVRAVRAAGVAWTEPQLLSRFGVLNAGPGSANRPASARVPRLLALTVCGSERDAVLAVDDTGEGVRLVVPVGDQRQVHRDNLRLLADKPGLRILAVARPLLDDVNGSAAPARFLGLPGTLELIAIGGADLRLPAALNGHVDLGFDRLSPRSLRPSGPPPPYPQAGEVTDPLLAYRRRLERVVSGGRRTLSVPGVPAQVRSEAELLRREQLVTAATLLERLLAAAQPAERNVFGRLSADSDGELARAWLTAGSYQRALLAAPL